MPDKQTIRRANLAARYKATLKTIERLQLPAGVTWFFVRSTTRNKGKMIRCKIGENVCCPITAWLYAKTGDNFPAGDFDTAGRMLRLPLAMQNEIVHAADDLQAAVPAIRAALLAKVGLAKAA